MHKPPKNSEESELVEILRNPKDWFPIEGEVEEEGVAADGNNPTKSQKSN